MAIMTEKQVIAKLAKYIDYILQENEEDHVNSGDFAKTFVEETIRPYVKDKILKSNKL